MKSLLCALLAAMLLSVAASADLMQINVPFDPDGVRLGENGLFTAPRFEGMSLIESDGQPCLPTLPVRIALPEGCRATSIQAVDAIYTVVQGQYRIAPAGPCFPLSTADAVVPSLPDPLIYSRDAFFPSDACMFNSSGAVWGIPIAYATIYPVRWNPATLELEVLQNLTLEIEYAPDPSAMLIERRAASSEAAAVDLARRIVINPDGVRGSGSAVVPERDLEYGQYVIIAPPGFEGQLDDLVAWKTAKGVPTEVYTTIWIDNQYEGYDLQQKIRAFLADCRDGGTDWVLLFGDDDILPARDVYMYAYGEGDNAPSDLYFADINDTGTDLWDLNGNHIWGESTDEVDYHPDLWVGRASVSTAAEAQIFVDKVMTYEAVPSALDYFETAPREMRIGYSTGILWEGYSGAASAEIISGYLPGIEWEEERCYEETGNSEAITIEMINAGPHHVYHSSHGGPTLMYTSYGSCYTVDDIMAQTNISSGHLPAIWNSIACEIGQLDGYECCGDAWLASPGGGGFGAFNSRFGWGHYGEPGYGPSERLCERFYYENLVAGVTPLGQAHLVSMDHFTPPTAWADSFDVEVLDWCIKEYNLFGDPEVPVWTEAARELTVDHPASIDGNAQIVVTVSDQNGPVENARICIQKGEWKNGDIYEVALTDASGQASLYAGPESVGEIVVTATAHNCIPYQGIITVTALGIGDGEGPVGALSFEAVRPCPSSGTAALAFSTPSSGPATIEAFDLTGRVVSTVFSGDLDAGAHGMTWDFTRNDGSLLPSGIYWLRLSSGGGSAAAQAVLLR